MKINYYPFSALLVLGVCLVSPVSGYTLLYENTSYGTTGSANVFHSASSFWGNMSVTHIEEDIAYVSCGAGFNATGTYTSHFHFLNTGYTDPYGNATATWAVSGTTGTLSIDILDINIPAALDHHIIAIQISGFDAYVRNTKNCATKYSTPSPASIYPWGDSGPANGGSGDNKWALPYNGTTRIYSGAFVTTPVAAFSCTPTSQYPDMDVVCTDTSTNAPTDWYWTIDAEAMGIDAWQTSTSRNFTWQSHYPGFYSVNLRANNSAGSDWENKSSYVSISGNATPNNCNLPVTAGYVRTYAQCMDSISLGVVSGCNIQLKDMEGGAWSNGTNLANGYWYIDSYPAHHINGYADATGYTATSNLNYPAGVPAPMGLLLIPGYVPAAPSGSVYVFAKVSDAYTLYPIDKANVQVAGSGVNSSSQATNAAGLAIFTVPNNTAMTFTAYKQGWISKSKTITTSPFGPDTAIIELERSTTTVTPTQTAGPGGTVAPTQDPYLNPDGSYPDGYSNMQGQNMLNWLAANGMSLIQLCFMVTVMALLGVKFGK